MTLQIITGEHKEMTLQIITGEHKEMTLQIITGEHKEEPEEKEVKKKFSIEAFYHKETLKPPKLPGEVTRKPKTSSTPSSQDKHKHSSDSDQKHVAS